MTEVGFVRRVAPAVFLAAAGGALLYLLPSGGDSNPSTNEGTGTPGTSSPSATPSNGSGGSGQRIVQGNSVKFKYGTVQVDVTLTGNTISDIVTITAPGGSYQPYTDRAIPEMKTRIITAQSTRVAAVSGASYTSEAYAQSVQSALDKA